MPRNDGTGPEGRGPMTGRGAGRCSDNAARTPNSGQRPGRGAGRGQGRGLGQRIADGFNNLRQRARGGNARLRSGRGRKRA